MGRFTRVEDVINTEDTKREWYYIMGYNGYEMSNDGYIRSMKHYKRYPYGLLIQPKKNGKGEVINPENPIYTLSNNNNERCTLHLSEIKQICESINQKKVGGYPRPTKMVDIASRNQRAFINISSDEKPIDNTLYFYPSFTITDDRI